MKEKWIVVLNQAQMRVYRTKGESRTLELVTSVENQLVHLRDAEISRHRPGVVREGGRLGARHHVMTNGKQPHKIEIDAFARSAAAFLDAARAHDRISELFIVAEPRMLGLLRTHLSANVSKLVKGWLAKDLRANSMSALAHEISLG